MIPHLLVNKSYLKSLEKEFQTREKEVRIQNLFTGLDRHVYVPFLEDEDDNDNNNQDEAEDEESDEEDDVDNNEDETSFFILIHRHQVTYSAITVYQMDELVLSHFTLINFNLKVIKFRQYTSPCHQMNNRYYNSKQQMTLLSMLVLSFGILTLLGKDDSLAPMNLNVGKCGKCRRIKIDSSFYLRTCY